MIIYVGSDHAGYFLKEKIKKYLYSKNIDFEDIGSERYEKKDDYPDFAFKVAEKVINNRKKDAKGVLICGTGSGMIIAANKIQGIRAVAPYDSYSAKMSRSHNDANIIGLRGKGFSFAKIKRIIDIWLNTKFSEAERHKRRLKKIEMYEKKGI
ncbi:MAG: RpiB/LacA/LacB family sugar-phosphate isomerase [Nanoarchaeota archaeon]